MSGEDGSAPSSSLRPGRVVGAKYELVRHLGTGGMGEVWLARHQSLRTELAVKFLFTGDREEDVRREALGRFRQEAQLSAQLGLRTRHIVRVHDVGEDEAGPFLVMEYIPGPSLRDEIRPTGALSVDRVGAIVAQLADALAVVHEQGIVHRDLKPENILLGAAPDGSLEVKLVDFGVAKPVRPTLSIDAAGQTARGVRVGTPEYMSPEHLRGGALDGRADCWALGVLTYEMLAGRNPFSAPTLAGVIERVVTAPIRPPSTVRGDLPPELDAWFARALERDRERRFPSVREMAVAFLATLSFQNTTVAMPLPTPLPVSPAPEVRPTSWDATRPATSRSETGPIAGLVTAALLVCLLGASTVVGWISGAVTRRPRHAEAALAAAVAEVLRPPPAPAAAPPPSAIAATSSPPAATATRRHPTAPSQPRPGAFPSAASRASAGPDPASVF